MNSLSAKSIASLDSRLSDSISEAVSISEIEEVVGFGPGEGARLDAELLDDDIAAMFPFDQLDPGRLGRK